MIPINGPTVFVDFVMIRKPHEARNRNPDRNCFYNVIGLINGKRGFGGDRFKHFR